MANTVNNVSVGKPKIGGAIFRAPYGTTLPTDATTALSGSYICLGYVSDDGLVNTPSKESEEIKAWGGDTVATPQTSYSDSFKFKLLETLDPNVAKAVYNSDNVTGDITNGMTIRANSAETEAAVWVFDMIMTDNVWKRIVVPNGRISEIGDIVYKDNEAVGYEVTMTALPGDENFDFDTHKEYVKKKTSGTSGSGSS